MNFDIDDGEERLGMALEWIHSIVLPYPASP